MDSRKARLQEDTYCSLMRILQNNPDLTQRELARQLGISVGSLGCRVARATQRRTRQCPLGQCPANRCARMAELTGVWLEPLRSVA